ncbi:sensor histidine kinase [Clostridium sp. DL1XJH146]
MDAKIYLMLLALSFSITFILGLYAILKKRDAKFAKAFFYNALLLSLWSFSNMMELISSELSIKLVWANIQYVPYCFIPWSLLHFSLKITGYEQWFRKKKLYYFMILSYLSLMFVLTDQIHGLFRTNLSFVYNGYFTVIKKDFSPYIFVQLGLSYIISMASLLTLVICIVKQKGIVKKRAIILLISQSIVLLPNILYGLRIGIFSSFDTTPVYFGIVGIINAWSIFKYGLLDITFVARDEIVKNMDIAYLVVDKENKIIDMNIKCRTLLGLSGNYLGYSAITVFFENKQIIEFLLGNKTLTEIEIGFRIYEFRLININEYKYTESYKLITAYDITDKKIDQKIIADKNRQLAVVNERKVIARDIHDNLGQLMAFVAMQSQGIKQEMINGEIDFDINKIDKIIIASQDAHKEIRRLIKVIKEQGNIGNDFKEEIYEEIKKFRLQTSTKPTLLIDGEFNYVSGDIKRNIKYIIKEALTNVAKHSKAKNVWISILKKEDDIKISIQDDGIGMKSKDNETNEEHYGLKFMESRVKEIDGNINFYLDYKGFKIEIDIKE